MIFRFSLILSQQVRCKPAKLIVHILYMESSLNGLPHYANAAVRFSSVGAFFLLIVRVREFCTVLSSIFRKFMVLSSIFRKYISEKMK